MTAVSLAYGKNCRQKEQNAVTHVHAPELDNLHIGLWHKDNLEPKKVFFLIKLESLRFSAKDSWENVLQKISTCDTHIVWRSFLRQSLSLCVCVL